MPFAQVAAVVFGIVALVKKQGLKGLAIAGIALGVVWTVAGAAFFLSGAASNVASGFSDFVHEVAAEPGAEFEEGSATLWDLALGDCYNDPHADDWDLSGMYITIVDCSEPHEFEVYSETEMRNNTFPGDEASFNSANNACYVDFTSFVGRPYVASELEYTFWAPDEVTWAEGDRLIQCIITDGPGTVGSLEGARR